MNSKLILIGLLGLVAFAFFGNDQRRAFGCPYMTVVCGCVCPTTYCGQTPPYFATHPPVYYSYRVARTRGCSPFAYASGDLIPSINRPRAVVVRNFYVTPSGDLRKLQREGRQPLRIANPFVEQPNGLGVKKGPKSTGLQPQVIYPAAMADGASMLYAV